jgi:hypothetical protein
MRREGMPWRELLIDALREYKAVNPDTGMTDWEILESLMEHLADKGLVRRKGKKYIVSPFIGKLQ